LRHRELSESLSPRLDKTTHLRRLATSHRAGSIRHGEFGLTFACFPQWSYNVRVTWVLMRRLSYILLAVVALQLVGVRLLCSPVVSQSHDCCPPAQEARAPAPTSLPACCHISTIPYQGSIGQTTPTNDSVGVLAAFENGKSFRPTNPCLSAAADVFARWPSASPPLEPLLQTCQLLI
jgi:hypothetical protein